ncbi:MAG TPA: Rne/Rng family ribonuclease [Bryobacteraceae bacterium]|nr:Rne/Rng family ribonuclease [Bryobacteraceae bacterium]
MSKELVISANRHETRVAIIEDDQVVEVYHQRENEYSLAGSIHKGRVTRVLPGMQSAFVDIGLDRDAFLYVSDFFEDNEEYDKIVTSVEDKVLKLERPPLPVPSAALPPSAPGAENAELAEARPAAQEVSTPPVEAVAPPATAPAPPPAPSQEQRRDDRDRRGRRSRRRRGQKGGGRSLPESKFYSPAGRSSAESEAARPAFPESQAPPVPSAPREQPDDFFVLPGESLAKYTRPGSEDEAEESQADAGYGGEPEDVGFEEEARHLEAAAATDEPEAADEPAPPPTELREEALTAVSATAFETILPARTEAESEPAPAVAEMPMLVSEIVAEPPAEPQPELAGALEEVREASAEAAGTGEIPTAEPEPEPLEAESAETAEDVDVVPNDAAEPEASELVSGTAEAPAEDGEPVEAAEAEASEEGEPLVEPEGPEPARIPTSLTATLREQGPRFLHRVSRRMRRRGRDGRGGPMQDANREAGRGPQPAAPNPAQDAGSRNAQERTASTPAAQAPAPRPEKPGSPSISDLLREGQEIIVQIAKEPLGQKGARITSHIALPGRFLVYMPTVDHIGVSRKIPSDEERSRLKRVLQSNRTGISGGYIVRTAGEGRTEEELRADMLFLYNLWLDMRQKAEKRPAPLLIHHDLNVVERVLRDQLTSAFKSIWVDNEEAYESVLRFVQRFQPLLVNRVKMYTRSTPIFEEFSITSELEKALRPKVWLKSGGYIVINQTEALVAIDVNTGKFVGKSNRLEDTIVKTNTDAIKEIVRQIRLRDLGGIIVVDFIDMDERKNRQKVMQALEEAMRADRAPYKILQFNDFGLVAITRKRVKQSLERTLCTPCPYCEGAGYVKSAQTVVGEILQEAHKISKVVEGKDVMLRVSPDVARVLKSNQNTFLQELEEILGRTVLVKSDAQLHLEKFDLA